jgi:hypothetical protein
VLFGVGAGSSWGGGSLSRVAAASVDTTQLKRLVSAGEVTPLVLGLQFASGDRLIEALDLEPIHTGVPALDRVGKTPLNEFTLINPVNYNHWAVPAANRASREDARLLIRRFPDAYVATVRENAHRFQRPATWDYFVSRNRSQIVPLAELSETVQRRLGWVVGVAWLLAAVALFGRRLPKRDRLLLAFLVGTIAWATAVGVSLEIGENNRFRYHLTGLHVLLLAWVLQRAAAAFSRRWGTGAGTPVGRHNEKMAGAAIPAAGRQ